MSGPKWTPAQRAAIEDRGGALLVSAAAGSGKTAVLTERAVRLITDPDHPVDADKLLIVTFTNAAAAELRARIGQALLRRSQQLSELHDPTLRLQAVPGQPLSRSRNSCGIRSRQRSVKRQERILLGLDTRLFGVVRHELFLILFLLMRIIERETQEDQGHDDNSGD